MASTALINGVNYAWSSIKFNLFGVPVVGITSIDYARKQKKENGYGYGEEPISRGRGNREYDASVELYFDEWRRIIAAAPSRDPLDIAPFDIQVLFGGSNLVYAQDNLRMCEFMDDPFTAKQGDTRLLIKIPLIVGGIQHLQ